MFSIMRLFQRRDGLPSMADVTKLNIEDTVHSIEDRLRGEENKKIVVAFSSSLFYELPVDTFYSRETGIPTGRNRNVPYVTSVIGTGILHSAKIDLARDFALLDVKNAHTKGAVFFLNWHNDKLRNVTSSSYLSTGQGLSLHRRQQLCGAYVLINEPDRAEYARRVWSEAPINALRLVEIYTGEFAEVQQHRNTSCTADGTLRPIQ